jgi:hypothetical protein
VSLWLIIRYGRNVNMGGTNSSGDRHYSGGGRQVTELQYQFFFDAEPMVRKIGQADHPIGNVDFENSEGLKYSSAWPWILALIISSTLWAFLVRMIWVSTR